MTSVKLRRVPSARGRPLLRWLTENNISRGKLGGGDGRTGSSTMVHGVGISGSENPDGMFANDHPVFASPQGGGLSEIVGPRRTARRGSFPSRPRARCALADSSVSLMASRSSNAHSGGRWEQRRDAAAREVRAASELLERTAAAFNQESERALAK